MRPPGPLRGFGRWVSDWRTGTVVVASVLVALLAVVVVDSIQARRASEARADLTLHELQIAVQELQRRGVRIDALAGQLEQAQSSRDDLAEQVRGLRELLIDRDVIEPRPQQTPSARPGTASPRPTPTPRPSPTPTRPPGATPPPAPASPSPSPSPSCLIRNPVSGACLVPADSPRTRRR